MKYEFGVAIHELMNSIKADYYRSMTRNGSRELNNVTSRMVDEFNADISFIDGKKYIKIVKGGGVWGFVVKEDGGKFRAGDILKAASWASPAKNFSRGNIFVAGYKSAWTGA